MSKNIEALIQYKKDKKEEIKKEVIKTIDNLLKDSQPLNIAKIATLSGVARSTIYRDAELRDLIDKFRETSVLRKNRVVKTEKELAKERSYESKLNTLKEKLKEERAIIESLKKENIKLKTHIEFLMQESNRIKVIDK